MAVQHGKSTLLWHWIAQELRRNPKLRWMYISYNQPRAYHCSREIRKLALAAGCKLAPDADAKRYWETTDGGGVLAEGIGGATGYPADRIVVDDPHADRVDAESSVKRKVVHDFFDSSLWTRRNAQTSIVVNHARWHTDDLIGYLTRDPLWAAAYENIPAISADGQALWPSRMPLSLLEAARARNAYDWFSLYQGEPRGRGQRIFIDAQFYQALPLSPDGTPAPRSVAIGLDFAYSEKTSSDWSVAVVMARYGSGLEARYFVLEVIREQCAAPAFRARLVDLKRRYPSAPMHAYVFGGPEKGVVDLLNVRSPGQASLSIACTAAGGDKFVRAQPFAGAWNGLAADPERGVLVGIPPSVFIPEQAPWAADYLAELHAFTGIKDRNDDQVDASASAFDLLAMGQASTVPRAFRGKLGEGLPAVFASERFQW